MASILFKYTIFLLNLLLFSQARLENKSKILVLSCSKLLNQKFKDQPKSEDFTKMMLSCFIKISQDQAQKISDRKESDSLPLKPEEINELFNIDNLKGIPEEEIKSNSELMNKFIQEIEESEKNIRRLVDMDNENLADNKDNIANEDIKDNNDNDRDNNANNENNNDNGDEIKDDDDDNEMDSNYYGDDDYMNDYNYESTIKEISTKESGNKVKFDFDLNIGTDKSRLNKMFAVYVLYNGIYHKIGKEQYITNPEVLAYRTVKRNDHGKQRSLHFYRLLGNYDYFDCNIWKRLRRYSDS